MDNSGTIIIYTTNNHKVLILLFCLLALIALLIFLYKKLNRETDGEYTIRRMVYKEGGVRDQVRGAAFALGTRLGVRLWPGSETDEDGEEMQEVQDEEGQLEEGGSQGRDSEWDDQQEKEDDDAETKGKGDDTSDENSSLEGSEAGDQTRLTDHPEAKEETEEKVGEGEGKGEASGGAGLLIDLKQFSGSAIWSEEEGGKDSDRDMTAL
ncbi:nucleolar transcription factor 1 [Xiphias gladius]|uniref:nucleolar transcription factor 1 n=1 Tax=Xiphias gladius TaxID=8245 RepID=UPI001A997FD2|nr:nucleolar transcription factor 1 [Xiphias gladius]